MERDILKQYNLIMNEAVKGEYLGEENGWMKYVWRGEVVAYDREAHGMIMMKHGQNPWLIDVREEPMLIGIDESEFLKIEVAV